MYVEYILMIRRFCLAKDGNTYEMATL